MEKHKELVALNRRVNRALIIRLAIVVGMYGAPLAGMLFFLFSVDSAQNAAFAHFFFFMGLLCCALTIVSFVFFWILKGRDPNVELDPISHQWFTRYGIEAMATVTERSITLDDDNDAVYWLGFVWYHPESLQQYTKRVSLTQKENYDACPLKSLHPVLFDPENPNICQFYRAEVRISDILTGSLF